MGQFYLDPATYEHLRSISRSIANAPEGGGKVKDTFNLMLADLQLRLQKREHKKKVVGRYFESTHEPPPWIPRISQNGALVYATASEATSRTEDLVKTLNEALKALGVPKLDTVTTFSDVFTLLEEVQSRSRSKPLYFSEPSTVVVFLETIRKYLRPDAHVRLCRVGQTDPVYEYHQSEKAKREHQEEEEEEGEEKGQDQVRRSYREPAPKRPKFEEQFQAEGFGKGYGQGKRQGKGGKRGFVKAQEEESGKGQQDGHGEGHGAGPSNGQGGSLDEAAVRFLRDNVRDIKDMAMGVMEIAKGNQNVLEKMAVGDREKEVAGLQMATH
ncbi:hypothetical protein KFL_009340010, partial [Klebsormidium nitens]